MTREEIQTKIIKVFEEVFELKNPGLDEHLRDAYGFDSIDAIELLVEMENILGFKLDRKQKEKAMEIRTINDIIDYTQTLAATQKK